MAARNDVTGDNIASRGSSKAYRDNWEKIFGKKKEEESPKVYKALKQVVDLHWHGAHDAGPARTNDNVTFSTLQGLIEQADSDEGQYCTIRAIVIEGDHITIVPVAVDKKDMVVLDDS